MNEVGDFMPLILLLVDDRELMQAGLQRLLERASIEVLLANRLEEAVYLIDQRRPHVILYSLCPERFSESWNWLRQICQKPGRHRVLAWGSDDNPTNIARAFAVRASGLLRLGAARKEIIDAVRAVATGNTVWHASDLAIVDPQDYSCDSEVHLSPRG